MSPEEFKRLYKCEFVAEPEPEDKHLRKQEMELRQRLSRIDKREKFTKEEMLNAFDLAYEKTKTSLKISEKYSKGEGA